MIAKIGLLDPARISVIFLIPKGEEGQTQPALWVVNCVVYEFISGGVHIELPLSAQRPVAARSSFAVAVTSRESSTRNIHAHARLDERPVLIAIRESSTGEIHPQSP